MYFERIGAVSFLLALFCVGTGCNRNQETPKREGLSGSYLSLPGTAELIKVGNDVLTKNQLEREVDFLEEMTKLREPKTPEQEWPKIRARLFAFSADRFVCRQLYLQEAKKCELTAPRLEDVVAVSNNYLAMAGQLGKDFAALKKLLTPESAKLLDERLASDALVQTYLKIAAGDSLNVTDEDYEKYCEFSKKQIAWSKSEYDKAMKLGRELVARFRNGEDFGKLADEYSIAIKKGFDGPGGKWGEFMPSTLLDEVVRVAVGKTAVGDCTEPIDTPEGLFIVLVEKRTGSGENSVVNLSPESVLMRRIVLRLPQMYKTMPREMFVTERQSALFRKTQETKLARLRSRANIEYPQGSNIWVTAVLDNPEKKENLRK